MTDPPQRRRFQQTPPPGADRGRHHPNEADNIDVGTIDLSVCSPPHPLGAKRRIDLILFLRGLFAMALVR
ncbi:MAG: hypothetical protein PVF20_07700 [Desulfobacterales bacterium]|jgi:hypothetical protein